MYRINSEINARVVYSRTYDGWIIEYRDRESGVLLAEFCLFDSKEDTERHIVEEMQGEVLPSREY